MAGALNAEYRYRFERTADHRSWEVIQTLSIPKIQDYGITERPQAMPAQYRVPGDPVAAYRQFYLAEKAHLLHWRKRATPFWVSSLIKS